MLQVKGSKSRIRVAKRQIEAWFDVHSAGSLGGGTSETLRNLVGKKLVEDLDLATGVLGMGMF